MHNRYGSEYDSRGSRPQNSSPEEKHRKKNSCMFTMYLITHIIISFFAIYLSFKCNQGSGGEFNPIAFAVALFCPYLYIIYALATSGGCGVFESMAAAMKPAPLQMT